ncbi:MAG: hypothetical protein C7M88_02755 [Candidatus Arcticimaribacter sp.]|nr:MAG: hypothetical protein C7M88_02755 [Candidatus Arcticimaribacter sp.]
MMYLDKLYYSIYFLYRDKLKSDTPIIYSVSVVVLMIFLHFIMLKKTLKLMDINLFELDKPSIVLMFIFLYIIFGLRYSCFLGIDKFNAKKISLIKLKNLMRYIIAFSFLLMFILVI